MLERLPLNGDVDCSEALAASNGISFSKELGLMNVIVEGDSLSVIEGIRKESSQVTSFGNIVQAIKDEILPFRSFSTSHVGRQGNLVAHGLVRLAKVVALFAVLA
ncbi:hypothetical protein U1Q18_004092 [Sarracenia purpurea var. burkii]